jgi:hypothetical protein
MTISIFGLGMQNKQYILLVTAFVMFIAALFIYIMQKKSE